MTLSFSIYLDLVRFFATLAVFLDHISSAPFTKEVIWHRLGAYGAVAVTIFFVLSGYVIAHVTTKRELVAKQYFSARLARLYSVVSIALLLTFAFDQIGLALNPDFYSIQKVLWKPESWAGYISSFFFINEFQSFGFNGISPGTNGPYWSLSFEATYYAIAGLLLFFPKNIWIPCSLLVLCLAGKTIVALFPIWILGYCLYKFRVKINLSFSVLLFLFLNTTLMLLCIPIISRHYLPADNFGISFPWGRGPFNRNILQDYFTAAIFSLHLVCAREFLSTSINFNRKNELLIRYLGSLTFPLYCIHYPAICLFAAVSPWGNTTITNFVFISLLTMLLVAGFTPICDALKQYLRTLLLTFPTK
ncbi:MAG: acyltransferase [Desulfobulbus sp.]|nr:acyltransferase [Desulfobulbus sp.]